MIRRATPRLRLLERQVGQDAAGDAGLDQSVGEAAVPVVVDDVVVGHHDERNLDIERPAPPASTDSGVAPPSSAACDACWITGPSITGSENGMPISIASAPLAAAARIGVLPTRDTRR